MVHTLPDHTTKYRMATIFGNLDNAELAARLGAASLLDRRGNYVWHEDFETAILNWDTTLIGVGAAVTIDGSTSFLGSQSCKLVTAAVTNSYTRISKKFAVPHSHRMGIEVTAKLEDALQYFEIFVYGFNGTKELRFAIEWFQIDNKIKYYGSDTNWHTFADDVLPTFEKEMWVTFKMVFDWDLQEYIRAVIGGVSYDLSGYAPEIQNNGANPYVLLHITQFTKENAVRTAYIDNVIFTQNEL